MEDSGLGLFVPRFQRIAGVLSALNSSLLVSLGVACWVVPKWILSVLLFVNYDENDDDDSRSSGMNDTAAAVTIIVVVLGGLLVSQGLGCLLLVYPMLVKEGRREDSSNGCPTQNPPNNSPLAVWSTRISVSIQFLTGLVWIVMALYRSSSSNNNKNVTKPLRLDGILWIGFVVFATSCLGLMLTFWPAVTATTSRTRFVVDDDDNNNELSEPLLLAQNESVALQSSSPLQEQGNDVEDNRGSSSSTTSIHGDTENAPEANQHQPTSRIRGTKRLLAVAAPQVVYLYIGCITLLIRLPFSLSIPHFVSTTLGALANNEYGRAQTEILWLFVLGTIDAFLDFWCIFWFGYANQRIVREIRIDTFFSILKQDIGFFDGQTSGELASRLNSDCGEMAGDLTWFFRFSIESVVRITGITAYMLLRSPKLGACAVSIVPLVAVVNKHYGNWLSENASRVQNALAAANSVAQETLGCIRTVVAFGSEESEHQKYQEKINEQYRLNIRQTYIQGVYYMFVSTFLINTIVQGTLLMVGSYMIRRGTLKSEILLAFMLYQGQLQNEMMNLFNSYSSLVKSTGAGDKIFELLDRKPPAPGMGSQQVQQQQQQHPLTNNSSLHNDDDDCVSIQFRDVEFFYPSRPDQPILKGINLTINAGSTFALVGPSGCGKSTIVNLLQRFYDVSSGTIMIDGKDLTSFNLQKHRHRTGIVTQDPTLFSGTILSNILYGMPDTTPAEEAIQAAKRANAHEFICSFPEGYHTQVGERGLQLSGGQKQRIAISRAIIRHPSLLLLDEATSALDAESEMLVQSSIDNLLRQSKSITTIIVAHRLRTVRNADCIAVINEGRIIELGSHNDLMSLPNGYYKEMIDKSTGDKIMID